MNKKFKAGDMAITTIERTRGGWPVLYPVIYTATARKRDGVLIWKQWRVCETYRATTRNQALLRRAEVLAMYKDATELDYVRQNHDCNEV
jgi:hypothetical protein